MSYSRIVTEGPTIAKLRANFNASKLTITTVVFLVLAGGSKPAAAIPVQVAWQVPLNPAEVYAVEISNDPGFGQPLVARQVHGSGFSWEAPGEGVYHWRLTRPGKTGQGGVEASTFVSGSFVAVAERKERGRPARLTWSAVAGADRYKLYVMDGEGQTRTMIAATPQFTVPDLGVPVVVEVVPYNGSQRVFRDYHFDPSLKLDGANKLPRGVSMAGALVAAPAASSESGSDTQVIKSPGAVGAVPYRPRPAPAAKPVTVPAELAPSQPAPALPPAAVTPLAGKQTPPPQTGSEPKAAPVATPAPAADPEATSGIRRHLVYFGFAYASHDLGLQKLDVELASKENVVGPGGGFWLNPVSGLIVAAQGSYAEHRGVTEQQQRFPGIKIVLDEAIYQGTFDLGFNLLAPFDLGGWMLALAVTGATAQAPALPLRMTTSDGEAIKEPSFVRHSSNLMGGTTSLGYLGSALAVVLEGGLTQNNEDASQLAYGRLHFDFYVSPNVAVVLSGFARRYEFEICDDNATICLEQGKSKTTLQAAGALLGMGLVIR